jgi:hypothetical protein
MTHTIEQRVFTVETYMRRKLITSAWKDSYEVPTKSSVSNILKKCDPQGHCVKKTLLAEEKYEDNQSGAITATTYLR